MRSSWSISEASSPEPEPTPEPKPKPEPEDYEPPSTKSEIKGSKKANNLTGTKKAYFIDGK